MMKTCPNCGFEGQAGARFCRQCGAPLFIERPATLAETRQQASPVRHTLKAGPATAGATSLPTHLEWRDLRHRLGARMRCLFRGTMHKPSGH